LKGLNWFGYNVQRMMVDGINHGGYDVQADFNAIVYQIR
jgi:hypothetical protein